MTNFRHIALVIYAFVLSVMSFVLGYTLSGFTAVMRREINFLILGKPLAAVTEFSLSSAEIVYLLATVLLMIGITALFRRAWLGVLLHALIITLFAETIIFFLAFVGLVFFDMSR